jgi:hypothetical protein
MAPLKAHFSTLMAAALCVGSTCANAIPASAEESSESFRLVAAHVAATTDDGRFVLTAARAEATAVATTSDGRFRLIETNQPEAGCEPFPDQLFANGFE